MTTTLTDLDQLTLRIWSPSARPYVEEAVTCYQMGANRAAIISVWVAVCVDLTEKIRWLATSGDAQAQAIVASLEQIIKSKNLPGMLEFERTLIDIAENKFELISHNEARQLERLKDDRGACAHPTFSEDGSQFRPIPELARLHIAHACDALLIRPPTQGKAILDALKMLTQEPSFPEDPEQAYIVLSSTAYLSAAKDTAIKNFAIAILKRVFKAEEALNMALGGKLIAAFIALSKINPGIFLNAIKDTLNNLLIDADDKFIRRLFLLSRFDASVWKGLNQAHRVRMANIIGTMPSDDLIKFEVPSASQQPELQNALVARLTALDAPARLEVLKTKPAAASRTVAISTFINSGSFDSAYSNGTHVLLPHARFLNLDEIERVLTGARENAAWANINQILNAGSIDEVFAEFFEISKSVFGATAVWLDFWNGVAQYHNTFVRLRAKLEQEGLIEPPAKQEDEALPF